MTTYAIQSTPKPKGAHWATMRAAADHLAHIIDDMAAMTRLYHGCPEDGDAERLDIAGDVCDPAFLSADGMVDAATELASDLALEIQVAHWRDSEYGTTGPLARVRFLLGFGGPNVYLDVDCSPAGAVQTVTLTRYWTEHDRAWSEDVDVQDVVGDFLCILGIE